MCWLPRAATFSEDSAKDENEIVGQIAEPCKTSENSVMAKFAEHSFRALGE